MLIDFGDAPVFDATAYPSIIVMQQGSDKKVLASNTLEALNWRAGESVSAFADIFKEGAFTMRQSYLTPAGWQLEKPVIFELMEKMRGAGQPLGEYVKGEIYYGIKTGFNEAFVIDQATRERLIAEDPHCEEIIKPFLRGRDVKRWQANPQNLWLINTHTGYGDTPAVNIDEYPVIKAHLDEVERKRVIGEFGEKAKILIPAITNNANYAYDASGYFGNDKTNICVSENAIYLLGVLNSMPAWWYIKQTASSKQNGFYELKPMYVTEIPIPAASAAEHSEIEQRVEKILVRKGLNPAADVSELEAEINQIVYQLYNLTPHEIAIVEGT